MSEPSSYLYHPRNILGDVRTGDEHSWADEFRFLWTHDRDKMLALLDSVLTDGIREPVVIGEDGRLHDGHHRMAAAIALQLGPIEVLDHRKAEETQ
ncbi:ParB N-terminal domain-containing protein [Rhodococcus erythropolis]|uniref:ParB N-terminal domain-containing protein n=1 Tax=Rhodococcus erythropolis TaxID=1833 RepID=UPI00367239EA